MIVDWGDWGDGGDGGDEETGRRGDRETRRMCSLINYSTANMRFCLFQG